MRDSFSYHSGVTQDTTVKPARTPERARPGRHRRRERTEPRQLGHRIAHDTTPTDLRATERSETQMQGGGGSSGGGGGDDDDGRKPDRDGNDAVRFLIALGIIAVGAGVVGARLVARAGRAPRIS